MRCIDQYLSRESNALHILVCNAGVFYPPVEQLTAQNYDLQFGVNALAHFLLIQLLLPLLKSSSNSLNETRIVWVGSSVQYYFTLHCVSLPYSIRRFSTTFIVQKDPIIFLFLNAKSSNLF